MTRPPLPPCTVGLGGHRWAYGDGDMHTYADAAVAEATKELQQRVKELEDVIVRIALSDWSEGDTGPREMARKFILQNI